MRHVFRWRSRSTQIASGVKGLSMGTWTDCGYPRGSWAAVGLNPRRDSPSGWGPFVETVCLVPAVALTGCVGSSGKSKTWAGPDGGGTRRASQTVSQERDGSHNHTSGHQLAGFGYRRAPTREITPRRLMSRERQSRHSAPICLLYRGGAGS